MIYNLYLGLASCNCITTPTEVACCISTISIDGHAHLSSGSVQLPYYKLTEALDKQSKLLLAAADV